MEKLAFTLITATRKLRLYFQAHTIMVQTDKPLRKLMDNLEATRRLVLWEIKLSKFNVRYCLRTAIKAQALAGFIAEFTVGKTENWGETPWKVQTNGSFNKRAGGIGVVL